MSHATAMAPARAPTSMLGNAFLSFALVHVSCAGWAAGFGPPPPPPAARPSVVAHPPSTLLQPGTTTLPLALTTLQPTTCRWSHTDVPYSSMGNTFRHVGADATAHAATLTGLTGTLDVSVVHVRCLSCKDALVLVYRSLPDVGEAPFPRLGNLWGSGNFRGQHPEGLG